MKKKPNLKDGRKSKSSNRSGSSYYQLSIWQTETPQKPQRQSKRELLTLTNH